MTEISLAMVTGAFFTVAVYLMLSKALIRILVGVAILGNAVNLLIFTAGRLVRDVPPIVPQGLSAPAGLTANPLPQALILTAIVIGFSILSFLLVLAYRSYQSLGCEDVNVLRMSEPEGDPRPPLSY